MGGRPRPGGDHPAGRDPSGLHDAERRWLHGLPRLEGRPGHAGHSCDLLTASADPGLNRRAMPRTVACLMNPSGARPRGLGSDDAPRVVGRGKRNGEREEQPSRNDRGYADDPDRHLPDCNSRSSS